MFKRRMFDPKKGLFQPDDNWEYLIRSGEPTGCSYLYSGDRVIGGQVFGSNEPPVVGGVLWGHGAIKNRLSISDLYYGNAKSGLVELGDTVTILGVDAVKFSISTGGYCGQTTGTLLGHTTGEFWIWSNISGDIDIRGGGYDTAQNLRVSLQVGINYFSHSLFFGTSENRTIIVDNRLSQTAGLEIAVIAQLIEYPYGSEPIRALSSGSPATIQTAAASPVIDDLHGLTAPCPVESRLRDLLDGKADGSEIIINGNFTSGLSGWTKSGPGTVELFVLDGTINIPSADGEVYAEQLNIDCVPGERYLLVFDLKSNDNALIRVGNGTSQNNAYVDAFRATAGKHSFDFVPTGSKFGVTFASIFGDTIKVDNVSVQRISPATGTLITQYALRPSLAQLQTTGHPNIVGRGVGADIIRINSTTGLFEAVDSAGNVAQSAQAYTPGYLHTVELHFDGSQMWLVVDETAGTKVTFSGTFDPGDNIKFGINNEDVSRIKTFKYRMVA